MQRIFYFFFFITLIGFGCRRETDYTQKVYNQIHGKYKAARSITSEVVDINGDGTASNNLLLEMDYLRSCDLVILIKENKSFLFALLWPEQYYNPAASPALNYACQGTGRFFTIAADNTTLTLKPDQVLPPDPDRWNFPSSVSIVGKDRVQVVFTKKLYTTAGWKSVTITTVYERYTMVT